MKQYLYLSLLAPTFLMAQENELTYQLSRLPQEIYINVRNKVIARPIEESIRATYNKIHTTNTFYADKHTNRAYKIALRNPSFDRIDTTEKVPLITMEGADGSEITIISMGSSRYDDHLKALPENYIALACTLKREPENTKFELVSIVTADKKNCYPQLREFGETMKEVAELDALVADTYQRMIGVNENAND